MKKIKLPNAPIGPFPAMLVGSVVNGKPHTPLSAQADALALNLYCAYR